LEFAEVDVAAEEAFACVEQAGEDAGADQAEYGFAESEADPRGGEEEAEQGRMSRPSWNFDGGPELTITP